MRTLLPPSPGPHQPPPALPGTGMVFGDATNLCLIALLLVLAVASFIGSTTVTMPAGDGGGSSAETDAVRLELRADGYARIADQEEHFRPLEQLMSALAGQQVQVIGDVDLPYRILVQHLSILGQHQATVSLLYHQESLR